MKNRLMIVACGLLLGMSISLSSPVAADLPLTLRGSGVWTGIIEVEVTGNTAYCSMVSGLMLLDVSDPSNPQFLSTVYLGGGIAVDIRVQGNYAYIPGLDSVFYVIDVSNPIAPVIAGEYRTPDRARGVEIAGSLAYVTYSFSNQGLLILDISNPASIIDLSDIQSPKVFPDRIRIIGDFAYLVGINGVWVVDISDPTQPTSVSVFSTGEFVPRALDFVEGDSLIYIADGSFVTPDFNSALTILNAADPSNLSIVGRYILPRTVFDVQVSDNLAYIANVEGGVHVFDVSDPTSPDSLGTYNLFEGTVGRIALSDSLVFAADVGIRLDASKSSPFSGMGILSSMEASFNESPTYETETVGQPQANSRISAPSSPDIAAKLYDFHVIDWTNPASPQMKSLFHLPGNTNSVAISGDYAYALTTYDHASWEGTTVNIVDISLPEEPLVVGEHHSPGIAERATVVDTVLYLAAGSAGLEIVNVFDKTNPMLLAGALAGTDVRDVTVRGNHAFVAGGVAGMWVYDVSDPANPQFLAGVQTPRTYWTIALRGNYAYIAGGSAGIDIVDITNPASPVYIKTFGTGFYTEAVIEGDFLYARGIDIFDISDPENPVLVGNISDVPDWRSMAVYGTHVFIAEGWSGFTIVDVSDPSMPQTESIHNTPGFATRLSVDDKNIYVADKWGLHIFENSTVTDVKDDSEPLLPDRFILHQNYPNPFNPNTTIEYSVPRRSDVRLTVYNIMGQKVAMLVDGNMSAGNHSVEWKADVASGVYLYKLQTEEFSESKKMLLLK